jgi:hypothetical protein
LVICCEISWIDFYTLMKEKHNKKPFYYTLDKNLALLTFAGMFVLLAISVIAEIFIPTYKTNPLLYTAFGIIAGAVIKSMGK